MKLRTIASLLHRIYRNVIVEEKKEVNFWILISFLFTFIASRLVVYFLPWLHLSINNTHIHHFSYGFFIMAIIGLLAMNDWHHRKRRIFGSLYGAGLALAMDEFAVWIHLDADYWVRHSYDAIVITATVLILLVYFDNFWQLIIRTFFKWDKETGSARKVN
jgi:hypothetical protein